MILVLAAAALFLISGTISAGAAVPIQKPAGDAR
jgi:hypothetical protein